MNPRSSDASKAGLPSRRGEIEVGTSGSGHITRRRTNSVVRRRRPIDSHTPSPPPPLASACPSPPEPTVRKVSLLSSSAPITLPTLPSSLESPASLLVSLSTKPKQNPSFPATDAHVHVPHSGHPRDLVPVDIGFPTLELAANIQPGDREDRLLMATCAVMHSHGNRALCPKEVAEVMFERGWLHNA